MSAKSPTRVGAAPLAWLAITKLVMSDTADGMDLKGDLRLWINIITTPSL
jgi:hypothetical protein